MRNLDETVPQARANRRPQVGASIGADSQTRMEAFDDQFNTLRAALDASLTIFDSGLTKAAIEAAVNETGAAGMKDMGKVIGVLRGKYAGQMDMAKASGMVKARLSG